MTMKISIIDILSYYLAKASVIDEYDIDWDMIKSIRMKIYDLVSQGFITVNYQNIPIDEYVRIDKIMCELMIKDMNKK